MKMRGFVVATVLLVLVNAFVLTGIAVNRHGEPGASLTLTEREMPLAPEPYWSESFDVALELDVGHWFPWQGDGPSWDEVEFAWLNVAKLTELGFDTRIPAEAEQAETFVQRQPKRQAYAVLEYEGPAWDAWKQWLADTLVALDRAAMSGKLTAEGVARDKERAEKELHFGSRLFIVDAGTGPTELRRKYPDRNRFLVLPANVRVGLQRDRTKPNLEPPHFRLHGTVSLLIDKINVPRRLHRPLPEIRRQKPYDFYRARDRGHEPRYQVVLRVGRRYEPWIEGIEALSDPPK